MHVHETNSAGWWPRAAPNKLSDVDAAGRMDYRYQLLVSAACAITVMPCLQQDSYCALVHAHTAGKDA